MIINENLLNRCLDDIIGKKYVFSAVLRVESGDGSFAWTGARGDMESSDKYFIASVTKLYVTAVVMSLIEERRISLDDKISNYLPSSYMERLHVLNGVDYSDKITVGHLISNTSGIPDYFFYKERGQKSAATLFFEGSDVSWELEKTLQYVKKMKPLFAPGQKGKVAYSDSHNRLFL